MWIVICIAIALLGWSLKTWKEKNAEIRRLNQNIDQLEFEAVYPEARRLRKVIELAQPDVETYLTVRRALSGTSVEEIERAYQTGKISKEVRNDLVDRYRSCEITMEGFYARMKEIELLEEKISKLRAQYDSEKERRA